MIRMNRRIAALTVLAVLLCQALPVPAQEAAPKPDLVVDIRNAGPGPLPDTAYRSTESFAACFVIMIGVQFVDFATLWAADPDRILRNPGGTITYTSPIRIQEPTAVRVWLDITEQVEEANEGNNIKQVLLNPGPAR